MSQNLKDPNFIVSALFQICHLSSMCYSRSSFSKIYFAGSFIGNKVSYIKICEVAL
jgi:hypothetical protein